jgi:hypothetical protein
VTGEGRVFEATLEAEVEDYVALFRLWQQRLEFIGAGIGIAALAFAALAFVSQIPSVALVLALAGIALIVLAQTRILDRWRARRIIRSRVGATYRMRVGPDGIDTETAGARAHVDWSALDAFKASDKVVILLTGSVIRAWFPLRVFAPDDRVAVVAFARSKLTPRTR